MALDTDGARVVIPHPPLRMKAVAGRPEFGCVPEKLVSNLTETKAQPHHIPRLQAGAVPLSWPRHQTQDPHRHCVRVFNRVYLYPATFGQGLWGKSLLGPQAGQHSVGQEDLSPPW